jgi:hypothetical protein
MKTALVWALGASITTLRSLSLPARPTDLLQG